MNLAGLIGLVKMNLAGLIGLVKMNLAGLIGLVKMNLLMSDDELSLRGVILRDAIAQDKQRGLIPFFVRLPRAANQRASVSPCSCSVHVYCTQYHKR